VASPVSSDFRDATGSAPKFLLGQKIETARANGSHQALSLSHTHIHKD